VQSEGNREQGIGNRQRWSVIILLCFSFFILQFSLLPVVAADQAALVPTDGWLGIYWAKQKMGYMHIMVDKAKYEDHDCNKVQSTLRTKLLLLGANVQQDISTIVYTDDHFAPYFQTFDMSSGGRKISLEAKFNKDVVKCKVTTDGSESKKDIPIPEGASLIGDSMYAMGTEKLVVGLKAKMNYFNPLTLSIDPLDVEVLRQEQVEVGGKTYDTFVVKNTTPMGDMTSWQTETGAIVKVLAPMGMEMKIESAEEAVAGIDTGYTPPADLAVLTSVKANIDIPNPETVKKLTVKLTGDLDPNMGISGGGQTVKWLDPVDEDRVAEFTIKSSSFDKKKSVKLPTTDKKLEQYLEPTPYLQSSAPEIKEQAAKIVGTEKSAYGAASKIRAWVSGSMQPQADIGIVRPAVDVLKMKVGVCRDYAVLYAALARAAGIPTKVVAGLVFMKGNFYYHAWAESYVGEWVPFDATLKSDFVDATHIKLTEGDATSMFQMARVFGSLKAEILKFE